MRYIAFSHDLRKSCIIEVEMVSIWRIISNDLLLHILKEISVRLDQLEERTDRIY